MRRGFLAGGRVPRDPRGGGWRLAEGGGRACASFEMDSVPDARDVISKETGGSEADDGRRVERLCPIPSSNLVNVNPMLGQRKRQHPLGTGITTLS